MLLISTHFLSSKQKVKESSGQGSRIMEVNEVPDGGEGVLVFWHHRLDTQCRKQFSAPRTYFRFLLVNKTINFWACA